MDHRQFNAHKIMEAPSPFNLKQALLNWREALGASPAIPAPTLDELETHLLGSLEALRAKGLSEEEAFYVAARRVGPVATLSREFAKINALSVWSDRALWALLGMLFLLILIPLADLTGFFAEAAAQFVPLPYLRAVIGTVVVVATEAGLAIGVYRLCRTRTKALASFFQRVLRHPYLTGLALFALMQVAWSTENIVRGATFGSHHDHAMLTGFRLLPVWNYTRIFVISVAARHRPFGFGRFMASVLSLLPAFLLVGTFLLLARRRWARA